MKHKRLFPWGQSWKIRAANVTCSFTILLILTWGLTYSSKKSGQQKKGALISKQGIEEPLNLYWGFKKMSCIGCLLLKCYFGNKKRMDFKSSNDFIRWLLNSFDLPRYIWFRIKEMIHTKAVVDISRGGGSFGSCSAWEGVNDSHGGRVCLRELRLGGNYANKL